MRDKTTYTWITSFSLKRFFSKPSKPPDLIQERNHQSETTKLCKTARNEIKVTYRRRQLIHKHKRNVDRQRTHTSVQR